MEVLYLDLCCYKRPFDDQTDDRIRREAALVTSMIAAAEHGRVRLVRSPALLVENDRNPREDRRLAAALWLNGAAVDISYNEALSERARELASLGFGVLDAFHVAFAEAAGASRLVTCDDRFYSTATQHVRHLRIVVVRPDEVILKEEV